MIAPSSLITFTAAACICVIAAAKAAIPLATIEGWRKSATDVVSLTATVVEVRTTSRMLQGSGPASSVTDSDVTATAKVDKVERSSSGLAVGATIVLKYKTRRYQPFAPPDGDFGVILHGGEKATAYLKKLDGNHYELAGPTGCLVPAKE